MCYFIAMYLHEIHKEIIERRGMAIVLLCIYVSILLLLSLKIYINFWKLIYNKEIHHNNNVNN